MAASASQPVASQPVDGDPTVAASVVLVSAGSVQTHEWSGRTITTGFVKSPVREPVRVTTAGVEGDQRAHPTGSLPEQAVYAYAAEDYAWWARRLDPPLRPPDLGENLTVQGVDVSGAEIGERWRVGDVVFEVAKPRLPCYKLAARMGGGDFIRVFADAGRPGAYLRVLEEGTVVAGDPIVVVDRPGHGVTCALVMAARFGASDLVPRLLDAPALPDDFQEWARTRIGADRA
jgi:MOSC domain-containing protein YiiM